MVLFYCQKWYPFNCIFSSLLSESSFLKSTCKSFHDPVRRRYHHLLQKNSKVCKYSTNCNYYYSSKRHESQISMSDEQRISLMKARLLNKMNWNYPHDIKYTISTPTNPDPLCNQLFTVNINLDNDFSGLMFKDLPEVVAREVRKFAYSRVCSYTIPTFAFANSDESSYDYRITPAKLNHIRSLGYRFLGKRSFLNFATILKEDSQAVRYVVDFRCGKPFLHESVEFVRLKIAGRSFAFQQIRKMVGLIVCIVSGRADEDLFVRSFSKVGVDIPVASSSGMVFENMSYDKNLVSGDVDFLKFQSSLESFFNTRILPVIYRKTVESNQTMKWLDKLNQHNFLPNLDLEHYDVLSRGTISDETKIDEVKSIVLEPRMPAVIKPAEKELQIVNAQESAV